MNAQTIPASRRHLVLGATCLLVLAGCGSIIGPSAPPPQIYRLAPDFPAAGAGGAPVSWQLAVAPPDTTQTIDTVRITLVHGETMDYYADAQWNDTVPRLVQSLIVEAFEQNGRIAAVAPQSAGLRAHYVLATDIRDFDAQYDSANGAPNVVVEIEAELMGERGNVVASLDARQTARATQNSVAAVVTAFDQATSATLSQIVVWALEAPAPPP